MKFNKGITLIEVMIICAILLILVTVFMGVFINNPGSTEIRAKENAQAWVSINEIEVKRMSCSFDSDQDGYGSCTIVTKDNEKISLQCVSSWFASLTGASGCKEIDTSIKLQ